MNLPPSAAVERSLENKPQRNPGDRPERRTRTRAPLHSRQPLPAPDAAGMATPQGANQAGEGAPHGQPGRRPDVPQHHALPEDGKAPPAQHVYGVFETGTYRGFAETVPHPGEPAKAGADPSAGPGQPDGAPTE